MAKGITIYTPTDAHIYAEERRSITGRGLAEAASPRLMVCWPVPKVDNNTVKLESGLYCLQGICCLSGGTTQNNG